MTKRTLFSRLKVTSQVQLLTIYTHELCLVFMFRGQPQKVREKDLVNDERESVLLVFSTAAFSPRSITALLSASRCTHGTRGVRSMTSLLCSQRCCRRLGKQKHVPKVDRSVSQHNNDKISVSELKGLLGNRSREPFFSPSRIILIFIISFVGHRKLSTSTFISIYLVKT